MDHRTPPDGTELEMVRRHMVGASEPAKSRAGGSR